MRISIEEFQINFGRTLWVKGQYVPILTLYQRHFELIHEGAITVVRRRMSLADELLADLEEIGDEPDDDEQNQVRH